MTDVFPDLEQTLIRELDAVASEVDVPALPDLPTAAPARSRRPGYLPVLVAAVALVAVMATVGALLLFTDGEGLQEPAPAPTPTTAEDGGGPISRAAPTDPTVIGNRLFLGSTRVEGEYYFARGKGTRWIAQRTDLTWWWGYDAQPQQIEAVADQPPGISPTARYHAEIVDAGNGLSLVGADTQEGGEGFGVALPPEAAAAEPAAVVAAVTDDGLVVARGSTFQVLYRPLVDGELVDLTETAPGQVVLGSTEAGLVVNDGPLDSTDGAQGEPYLAELDEDGTLTRIGPLPTHDALVASEDWVASVPAGSVGGEASGVGELAVQRVDGTDRAVLTAPLGWLFVAPGFWWESPDRLVSTVVSADGMSERIVRCRPRPAACVLVDAE